MKKPMIYFMIIFWITISIFLLNLLWKWIYQKWVWKTISLELHENRLLIFSDFWRHSSSQKVSFIDNEINLEKHDIYISIYTKYYSWENSIYTLKNSVFLNEKWKYNVYYKNPDWSLEFVKEIEYR